MGESPGVEVLQLGSSVQEGGPQWDDPGKGKAQVGEEEEILPIRNFSMATLADETS